MITNGITSTLNQGLELLGSLTQEDYTQKFELVYNASIGGHYRHLLEHFTMLLETYTEGFVNYDLRSRNTDIETCRDSAIQATNNVIKRFESIDESVYTQPIKANGRLSHGSEDNMDIDSSVGREAAYSIAHANHHFALIGVMCNLLECQTSDTFGIAPSTAQYNAQQGSQTAQA